MTVANHVFNFASLEYQTATQLEMEDMARLSHLDRVVVPEAKIANYLLSLRHPVGRMKARFLRGFGFQAEDWRILRNAIIGHAMANEITKLSETSFGIKYEIDGPLLSPDGRNPVVRVVWFVDLSDPVPRLVTLIPRIVA